MKLLSSNSSTYVLLRYYFQFRDRYKSLSLIAFEISMNFILNIGFPSRKPFIEINLTFRGSFRANNEKVYE